MLLFVWFHQWFTFVFYRLTSIWENSLQITTISSFVGTWLGAFPIPLDWERPWQVGFSYLKQQNKCLYNNKTDEAINWNWCVYKLFCCSIKQGCQFRHYNLGDVLLGPVPVPQASTLVWFYLPPLFFLHV